MGRGLDDVDFVLPTHLHWDHVCGLRELSQKVPVRTLRAERDFALAATGAPLRVATLPLRDRQFDLYDLPAWWPAPEIRRGS